MHEEEPGAFILLSLPLFPGKPAMGREKDIHSLFSSDLGTAGRILRILFSHQFRF